MQEMKGAAHIFECARPSPSFVAQAAVFNVPCGNARFFQRLAKMSGVGEVVFRPPVAAVNEKDNRVRPFVRRYTHVHKLIGITTIGKARVSSRRSG